MEFIRHAARLNNEAVSLLVSGHNQSALQSLVKSIAVLKRVSRKLIQMPSSSVTFNEEVSLPIDSPDRQVVAPTLCIHFASSPLEQLDDRQCYIYDHALSLNLEQQEDTPINDVAQACCAVAIFNMALAHHRGCLLGDKKCLKRATMLYAMVVKLLRNNCSVTGTAGIVKLASINNLAQLRFSEGDFRQAREEMNHLSVLMQFTKSQEFLMVDCDLRAILLNVMFLRPPEIAAAA